MTHDAAGGDPRVRLFVALDLPGGVRDELVAWRQPILQDQPGLRAVGLESLHVTLCFIGSRPAAEIEPIAGACRSVAGLPARSLRLAEAVWLPARRPRVLAVALEDLDGGLSRVQAGLSALLAERCDYRPEQRPFLPHVTVARVRRGVRIASEQLPAPARLRFAAETVTLFRSHIGPGGAHYEPLDSVPLAGDLPGTERSEG